jgi:hypothetical protein
MSSRHANELDGVQPLQTLDIQGFTVAETLYDAARQVRPSGRA